MIFEIGKAYIHTSGIQIKILAEADSTVYGECLICENPMGDFLPVGKGEEHTVGWAEIPIEVWNDNFISAEEAERLNAKVSAMEE